jgi:hypothetical protein
MYIRVNPSPRGSWLTWLLLLPLIAVAVVFGLVVFLAVLALVAVVLVSVFARLWWLQRKLKKQAAHSGALEGEYIVVREESRTDERLR